MTKLAKNFAKYELTFAKNDFVLPSISMFSSKLKRASASECLPPLMSRIAEKIKAVMNDDDLNLSPVHPSQLTGSGTIGLP